MYVVYIIILGFVNFYLGIIEDFTHIIIEKRQEGYEQEAMNLLNSKSYGRLINMDMFHSFPLILEDRIRYATNPNYAIAGLHLIMGTSTASFFHTSLEKEIKIILVDHSFSAAKCLFLVILSKYIFARGRAKV
ncbi:hypothetical protein ACJX0J_012910 [Zea mays]